MLDFEHRGIGHGKTKPSVLLSSKNLGCHQSDVIHSDGVANVDNIRHLRKVHVVIALTNMMRSARLA